MGVERSVSNAFPVREQSRSDGRGPSGRVSRDQRFPDSQGQIDTAAGTVRCGHLHSTLTNVICYATPMSRDLRLPQHKGGEECGKAIFQALLDWVRPKVLIAHGSGTGKTLGQFLGAALPSPPLRPVAPVPTRIAGMTVFVIPSLAPPQWNQWAAWAGSYMVTVARAAVQHICDQGPQRRTRT